MEICTAHVNVEKIFDSENSLKNMKMYQVARQHDSIWKVQDRKKVYINKVNVISQASVL